MLPLVMKFNFVFHFRLEFYPGFLMADEAEWMFEQLKAEVPWEEKHIRIKGQQ